MPSKTARLRARFFLTGVLVLALGLVAATVIWFTMPAGDYRSMFGYDIVGGRAYGSSLEDARRQTASVERLGGKAAVLTLEFHQWFSSWWHGRRLAITITLLSVIVALGCFRVGSLVGEDVDS